MKFRFLAPALAFLLVSCGGGGAPASDPKPSNTQALSLTSTSGAYTTTITPGKISVTVEQGWDALVEVEVVATGPYDSDVAIKLSDAGNVTTGLVPIWSLGSDRYAGAVNINPKLPPGRYTGELQLIVCKTYLCTDFYPGSPWSIPYDVTVTARTSAAVTPLQTVPGAPNWTGYQGGAAHTGYVPLTATRFDRRWNWSAPFESSDTTYRLYNGINSVGTYDGVVYLSTQKGVPNAGFSNFVYALSEENGQQVWRTDLGDLSETSPPGLSADRVFVASSGQQDTAMWQLDRLTGQVLHNTYFASQWPRYLAPTTYANGVYNTAGYLGGLAKWSTTDGTQAWWAGWWSYYGWAPAVSAQYVLGYDRQIVCCQGTGGLKVLAPDDGSILFTIEDPESLNDNTYKDSAMAPVLTSSSTVVATNGRTWNGVNRLLRFDLASRSVTWSVPGSFPANPVYANGILYIAQSAPFRIEARRESDGVLLWTWTEPLAADTTPLAYTRLDPIPAGSLAITDSHVFVSSARAVYAISLQDHQPTWSYPRAGEIAISSKGVLYISTRAQGGLSDGRVVAITLR